MSDLARLKAKRKTWTREIEGDEYMFRELSNRQKSELDSLVFVYSKETGNIEFNGDQEKVREQILRTIAYQWIDAGTSEPVVREDEWESIGDLSESVVGELLSGCRQGDSDAEAEEEEAVKNSE